MARTPVSKEDYEEWLNLPVTKAILEQIADQRQHLLDAMEAGATLGENSGLTAQLTARLIGELAGVSYILNKEFINFDV